MERDSKGRFLPGNRAAVGNKGNTKSKYGNKNAMKHGLYQTLIYPKLLDDGRVMLVKGSGYGVEMLYIHPDHCWMDEHGDFWFTVEALDQLRERGWHFKTCKPQYFE